MYFNRTVFPKKGIYTEIKCRNPNCKKVHFSWMESFCVNADTDYVSDYAINKNSWSLKSGVRVIQFTPPY